MRATIRLRRTFGAAVWRHRYESFDIVDGGWGAGHCGCQCTGVDTAIQQRFIELDAVESKLVSTDSQCRFARQRRHEAPGSEATPWRSLSGFAERGFEWQDGLRKVPANRFKPKDRLELVFIEQRVVSVAGSVVIRNAGHESRVIDPLIVG
jgi:hypothetical protein